MLLYKINSKMCPVYSSYSYYNGNDKKFKSVNDAIKNYNNDLFLIKENRTYCNGAVYCWPKYYPTEIAKNVFNTYETLKLFNNILTNTNIVDNQFIESISFIDKYLQEYKQVSEWEDIESRKVYEKLNNWYYRLTNNPDSLDTIKWEVARFMKHYEKKGIYIISNINPKRNYYDFVV